MIRSIAHQSSCNLLSCSVIGLHLTLISAGCTREPSLELIPARGVVTRRGTPVVHGFVVFHPQAAQTASEQDRAILPWAWTDQAGLFSLTSLQDGDGAPRGEYRVTVIWPGQETTSSDPETQRSGADRLKGRYTDPSTSGIVAQVDGGQLSIDLK